MDIHKPKPWHGLREFLKEYVIIVVGVLTALAGEQAVEAVHRQQEVGEAREALREVMVADATLLKLDLEEVPCVQARLDRIAAWANGGDFPPVNMGRAGTELSASAWDQAKAMGAAPGRFDKARVNALMDVCGRPPSAPDA